MVDAVKEAVGLGQRTQRHHIFPTDFCSTNIADWDANVDSANVALNIMRVTPETNRRWKSNNPYDHINDMKGNGLTDAQITERFKPFFISERAIEILKKPLKTRSDFHQFVAERESTFAELWNEWGLVTGGTEDVDED